MDPAGNYTLLYSFTGGADGGGPQGGVIGDPSGNLYGTTFFGGQSQCQPFVFGCGTIFKLGADGTETVLFAFNGFNGSSPGSPLAMDRAGNLYGVGFSGGNSPPEYFTQLFKLDNSGNLTVVYTAQFIHIAVGAAPVIDVDGNIYDTDYAGSGGFNPVGEVFKVSPEGNVTILYGFTGGVDGAHPESGVILDSGGNVYGTTNQGGSARCSSGCGVVFQIGRRENHVCAVQ